MHLLPATPIEKLWWVALLLLLGGYLAGTWLNRKRSKALGFWLQSGLGVLGSKIQWKWIGTMSSGAQVTVRDARKPFRQLEITYLLLTRELAPLWGIELLRGKRDLLILRGDLRFKPAAEFEVVPAHGKLRDTLDAYAADQPWQWAEMSDGLALATPASATGAAETPARSEVTPRIEAFLQRYGAYIRRLSLRERSPNLILFARLTGMERSPAKEFLEAVAKVASADGNL